MTNKILEEELKELSKGIESAMNKCVANGTEVSFVKMIDFLERNNYDTSHYKQSYQKAVNYLKKKRIK